VSDDIVARLRKIREMIGAMCADGRPPRMSIPARPDDDEDIVISDAADDAADLIDQQAARIKELERDAEWYCNDTAATEINSDSFYWSRNEKAKSATIVAEMNAIFGMTEGE